MFLFNTQSYIYCGKCLRNSIFSHEYPLMKHILYHWKWLEFNSFTFLTPAATISLNNAFWLCEKNFEDWDSSCSEQQTVEKKFRSSAENDDAESLDLVSGISSGNYDLDSILHSEKLDEPSTFQKRHFDLSKLIGKNTTRFIFGPTGRSLIFTSNFGKVKSKCSN